MIMTITIHVTMIINIAIVVSITIQLQLCRNNITAGRDIVNMATNNRAVMPQRKV